MFPVIVPRILEIGRWAPVVETRFSKAARETSAICNFAEICNTCVGMFWEVTLLKISVSLLLTRVAGFQNYNAIVATYTDVDVEIPMQKLPNGQKITESRKKIKKEYRREKKS